MVIAGIAHPSDKAVHKAISKEELARHCKRKTKGTDITTQQIESLILSLSGATDVLGVPLYRSEITTIWEEQKKHVKCIQDPPGIPLYTVTGNIKKGGINVPVFRCARGTTSLESYHLHLARFIPGTSASPVNFQAYLLDGITRWNTLRAASSIQPSSSDLQLRIFDTRLQQIANKLSMELHGRKILPHSPSPSEYTGEVIGVQYLFGQSGLILSSDPEILDAKIDEGVQDMEFKDDDEMGVPEDDVAIHHPVSDESSDSDTDDDVDDVTRDDPEAATDSRGIPGWERVDILAQALIALKGLAVTDSNAKHIIKLWDNLLAFDRRPLTFPSVLKKEPKGRFKKSKSQHRSGYHGVNAMKRCFLSGGAPALSPSRSRLVEAIAIRLCSRFTQAKVEKSATGRSTTYISRWKLILSAYNEVRMRLHNSLVLLEGTNIVLFHINETTLTRWFKNEQRRQEVTSLMQGRDPPGQLTIAANPLPSAMKKTKALSEPPVPHTFHEPDDRTGQAAVRRSSIQAIAETLAPTEDYAQNTDISALATLQDRPSRTTEWRHKKRSAKAEPGPARKQYSCRICNKPMSSGNHTQFRGKRYCPDAKGVPSKDEWLAARRKEAAEKKALKDAEQS